MTPDVPTWVFAYGSLIYKIDFPYLERQRAYINGWERRFWQGSHDHRGTPESPGRVVTLMPSPGRKCGGLAYLVEPSVFEHLDHREKNGYRREATDIHLTSDNSVVYGLVYVADTDNHAFLGTAPLEEIASQISRSQGPSGSNVEYLLNLDSALRELGEHDQHVTALADAVRADSTN